MYKRQAIVQVEVDPASDKTKPPTESAVRESWDGKNGPASGHAAAYEAVAGTATAKLLAVRKEMVSSKDPLVLARGARRIEHLEALLADAKSEVAKVDGLYEAWCDSHLEKYPQHVTVTLAIDELRIHADPTDFDPPVPPAEPGTGAASALWHLWATLGVMVEIGPVSPGEAYRPNSEGLATEESYAVDCIHWRNPRPARLWIWRRNSDGNPVLETVSDTWVSDRYSNSNGLRLVGRAWGEEAVVVALNDLGTPTKVVLGSKSAVGAIADAISAAPEQFTAGLESASKVSTSLGDLSSAGAELRLKAIKREVERRTQELEREGINATAADFAELKRLKQRVEIATAQGSLAPPSALAELEADLARETTQRDLEEVRRDRVESAELATVHSEVEQLKAEVELMKLRAEKDRA